MSNLPVPSPTRHLRLWPGVLLVILQLLLIITPHFVAPATMTQFLLMFWTPIVTALLLIVWWLFASRLLWADRLLGLFLFAGGGAAAAALSHPTFRFPMLIYGLPVVNTVWVLWLLLSQALSWPARRLGLVITVLLAWAACTPIRYEGAYGSMTPEFSWRWQPTAEDRYLQEIASEPAPTETRSEKPLELGVGDWPGFRGFTREGKRFGTRFQIDWTQHPPRLLWKQRIGPGWSSFAVVGDHIFTQEQRGPNEAVVCYHAETGKERWSYLDNTRFFEIVAGAGPRATPTFHEGRLYSLGANGILNCLDPVTGKKLWSRDIVKDSGAKIPQWGFSSSPLVAAGIVSVYAGAPQGKALLGYYVDSGEPAWHAGEGAHSYCSSQLARIAGVDQLLINTEKGLTSFEPASGKILWNHAWELPEGMARVIQPALVGDSDILIGTGFGYGTRRVKVLHPKQGWTTEEVWTSRAIKPYYNDLVVHGEFLYGFDGIFFVCVALEDGEARWKRRGYGNGQVLLLPDQDLLLILSEQGEVALVKATPEKHELLGKIQALEGKTWNHPVIANGKLFVRNAQEVACFELAEQK